VATDVIDGYPATRSLGMTGGPVYQEGVRQAPLAELENVML